MGTAESVDAPVTKENYSNEEIEIIVIDVKTQRIGD
jgi:hypothetical protein